MKHIIAPALVGIIACTFTSATRADTPPPPPPPPPSVSCLTPNAASGPLGNYCAFRCGCGCYGTEFYMNVSITPGMPCSAYNNQALGEAQQFCVQNPSYIGPCNDAEAGFSGDGGADW